jgi:hypothetical protein
VATDSSELKEGDLLGGNEIEARIGSGGFGIVYRARDPRGTPVAVKVLTAQGQDDPDIVLRLMKEATLLAELEHDNVVRFHAAGKEGTRIWLAMEYVTGGTLREKLPRNRPIEVEQALRWTRHIAAGVAEVHKLHDAVGRPVVHRDLKPENVLLTRDGIAKVTDFGIAKFRTSVTSTASNERLGTPLYMAPEQMDAGTDIDERADVFALGVILYEMLAGKRPAEVGHEGELTMMEKVTRSILRDVTPLPELNPDVPDHVWRIAERALEKKRELRFGSMREMEEALVASLKRVRRERGKQPSFAEMSAPHGAAAVDVTSAGEPGKTFAEATTAPAPFAGQAAPALADASRDAESSGRVSTLVASSRSLRLPAARRLLPLPVLLGGMALGIGIGALVFRSWTAGAPSAPTSPPLAGATSPQVAPGTLGDSSGSPLRTAMSAGSTTADDAGAPPVAPGSGAISQAPPVHGAAPASSSEKKPTSSPEKKSAAGTPAAGPGKAKCAGIACDPDF